MIFKEIVHIEEPNLIFSNGQKTKDPRDGLLLYGPYEKWSNEFNARSISVGLIGPSDILNNYKKFVRELKKPIFSIKREKTGKLVSNELQRPSYPGFEAVFNIEWPETPSKFIKIKRNEIETLIKSEKNKRIRTDKMVDLFLEKIKKTSFEEDVPIDIWFVIVPKVIYKECRTSVGEDFSSETKNFFKEKASGQMALFSENEMFGDDFSRLLDISSDFRNLLKAKANQEKISAPLQLIVEPKLSFRNIQPSFLFSQDMKAHFAWSITTTLYYKLGKKPWKIDNIREGVCYLGLVFKKFPSPNKDHYACSAAQLFMDDGDGAIFRGNNGLWLSENKKEFHLDQEESFKLLNLALNDYHDNHDSYPKELFIHGRAQFSEKEWQGFLNAVNDHDKNIKLTGIVIKDKAPLKMFRDVPNENSNYGVLRGTAVLIDDNEAYLFARGFIPRLNTSNSLETPNPLHIKISKGNADITTVLQDIMALTKVNYNSCIYGDGKPVTLSFSDKIGSILTATDNWKEERRQFKYYI
ncbi:MAG: hypothetical protein AAGC43_16675 [Bacteroidota bacterium]